MRKQPPVALIILDGFALRDEVEGNAVAKANTPNFDRLWKEYPHATLIAAGEDVGLPAGQMGNSEVGHMNIGAGRVIHQNLSLINKGIAAGTFFLRTRFSKRQLITSKRKNLICTFMGFSLMAVFIVILNTYLHYSRWLRRMT